MADSENQSCNTPCKSYFKKGGELIINYQLEYYEKNLISNLYFMF